MTRRADIDRWLTELDDQAAVYKAGLAAHSRIVELVVKLLRAGVPRSQVVDRPLTNRTITKIQQDNGLTRRQKKETGK
jgi:hypothetical protein